MSNRTCATTGLYPSVKLQPPHTSSDTIVLLQQRAMAEAAAQGRISPGNVAMLNESMTAICIPASKVSYALDDEDFALDVYDTK